MTVGYSHLKERTSQECRESRYCSQIFIFNSNKHFSKINCINVKKYYHLSMKKIIIEAKD
jgi:hypothetical protein